MILLHRVSREQPLIVAANRDEIYARPASGPVRMQRPGAPAILAGMDEDRGGTWMGVNERGLFVGLTNQRAAEAPDRTRRSRGHVVLEALGCADLSEIRRFVARLRPDDFNGFNLVYGDGLALEVAYARPDATCVRTEPVAQGLHVLPNDVLDSPRFIPKVRRVHELLEGIESLAWPALAERLSAALSDHNLPESAPVDPAVDRFDPEVLRRLQALCIHLPFYGTRSATIAAIEPGRVAHYLFAPGPSCETPFEEHRTLLMPGAA